MRTRSAAPPLRDQAEGVEPTAAPSPRGQTERAALGPPVAGSEPGGGRDRGLHELELGGVASGGVLSRRA